MFQKEGLRSRMVSGLLAFALGLLFALPISSPLSVRAASTWPVVRQGDTGENVWSIQLFLQARGYSLSIDGDFGPQTASTVEAFQSAQGLSVDGIVGLQTWPVLVVATWQGSTGSAVEALQRQLNADGAHLAIDSDFGPATAAAVRSFQQSKGLTVDGIASPQTWKSLVNSESVTPPPSGSTLWGVDTASIVDSSFLNGVINTYGKPAFVGRYLNATAFLPLLASEVSFLHSQSIRILVIESDPGNDTTYSKGASRASLAVSTAQSLGVPEGTAIFGDIETNSSLDSGWIEGWYDTILAAGYVPGYYENPLATSSAFTSAYCAAVSEKSTIATQSILYSAEPSLGRTPATNAPSFAPRSLSCNGIVTGQTLVWQYGLAGGNSVNVDTDELTSSVPLW